MQPRGLRRSPGPQGGDRQGARLPLAALHRALHPQHARPLPAGPARHGLRRPARDLQRRGPRGRPRAIGLGDRAACASRCRRWPSCSRSAEEDLLAFYRFPPAHWSKLRSTNPLERVNKEIGRRSRRRRDLPQRRLGDPPGRRAADRAERRVAGLPARYLSEESIALVLEDQAEEERKEVADLEAHEGSADESRYTTTRDLTSPHAPSRPTGADLRSPPPHRLGAEADRRAWPAIPTRPFTARSSATDLSAAQARRERVPRYEWPCPGDLLHIDTKRYARFDVPGTGDRDPRQDRRGDARRWGWEFAPLDRRRSLPPRLRRAAPRRTGRDSRRLHAPGARLLRRATASSLSA